MTEERKIEGLTPELLSDIYDIVEKFGTTNEWDQVIDFRSGDLGIGHEIFISKSAIPGNRNIVVTKSLIANRGINIVKLENAFFTLDNSLTIEELKNGIKKIDEFAKKCGLIDKDNNRIELPKSKIEENKKEESQKSIKEGSQENADKYKVDDMFTKEGTAFMIPPEKDPENMLKLFDHPERLMIIKDSPIQLICLKADSGYIEKRRNVVFDLLKERELDIKNIKDISLDQIFELREEIKKRLQ